MRLVKINLVMILLGVCQTANATVDYLAVNHITKELYVYDEEAYQGLFWVSLAGEEKAWIEKEKLYLDKGYTYTTSPYKSEFLIILLIPVIVFLFKRSIQKTRHRA